MITKGDVLRAEEIDKDTCFFSSYKGKYILLDNMAKEFSPVINPRPCVFNTQYIAVYVVTEGAMRVKISGQEFSIRANEYLSVMPCVHIEILKSECRFFSFFTLSHIVNDIYERIGVSNSVGIRCFFFHHHILLPEQTKQIYQEYERMKKEHLREDYKRKEVCLRALLAAYECHLFSYIHETPEYDHFENSRQREFFLKFLDFLSLYCKRERSVQFYAEKLKITPKYLSNLTNQFTGFSASILIDQYVAYSIKRMLYSNEFNIKKVSDIYHFPSQSFFGRYFKRIVGMSPTAYIKENNSKAIIEG